MEQLWSFAWPAAIALLHPSLLPVAVMGFCTKVVINQISLQNKTRKVPSNQVSFEQLAVIAGGPLVGKLMDQLPRVPAYSCLSAIQVIHLSNNCG